MKALTALRAKFREMTDADNEELPRWQRALLYAVELGRFAAHKLRQDRAPQMAAALTYHTLFSLLPTLVLTLVVAQAFVSEQQLADLKAQTVDWAVQWLETDGQKTDAPGTADEAADAPGTLLRPFGFAGVGSTAWRAANFAVRSAEDQRADALAAEYAATAGRLDEQLTAWLDQLQNVNFGSIGLVGVLIFIYGATKLLATIEDSFNLVLRAEENRSWYVRLPLYYTTITLAPVVLLAGQWAQRQFLNLLTASGAESTGDAVASAATGAADLPASEMETIAASGSSLAWLVGPFVFLSPLLTTWLVLLLAYRLLPNTTIRIRPAAIGSFVAAVALGLAVEGFSLYVSKTGSTSLYGALALLPLFLLLLWIVWQVVLYGLELASVLQFMPSRRERKQSEQDTGPKLVDPRLIIPALVLFAKRFREGEPLAPETLANELQLPAGATEPILAALVQHGYLHKLDGEESCYALARSPDQIEVAGLLETANQLGRADVDAINTPLMRLDHPEQQNKRIRTLVELL